MTDKFYTNEWNITSDLILSRNVLDEILKFHMKTTFNLTKNNVGSFYNPNLKIWMDEVEKKIPLPNNIKEIVKLKKTKIKSIESTRQFNKDKAFNFTEISNALTHSFGIDKNNLSRKFPSAGALFPVYPILLVFDNTGLSEISSPGSYYYNGIENELYLLKKWEIEEMNSVKNAFCPLEDEFISNTAIAYIGDIRKSAIKYRYLGYKHVMIETGMLAQTFRESLNKHIIGSGDLSYSAFNDNMATKLSGFNSRVSPIILLQWFGKKDEERKYV